MYWGCQVMYMLYTECVSYRKPFRDVACTPGYRVTHQKHIPQYTLVV